MTTELATAEPSSGTLALTGDQIEWTPVQRAALAHIGIEDAPKADQQVFMHVAQRTGLDPFARQIYMIARREKQPDGSYKVKWTIQTGIDGFRLIAERHPQYAGTLDPEWCGPDGAWHDAWVEQKPPVAARVKVLRHDRAHPIALPVRFVEFADTFQDGGLKAQWKSKPAHMIGKVAEAAGLRKAFPQDFSGIYIPEEMDRDATGPAPRTVVEHRDPPTVAELTGAGDLPTSMAEPVTFEGDVDDQADNGPAEPPGSKRGVEPKRMKRLFALLREADVGDRHQYASGVLHRSVETYTTLTAADVETLIGNLEAITQDDATEEK